MPRARCTLSLQPRMRVWPVSSTSVCPCRMFSILFSIVSAQAPQTSDSVLHCWNQGYCWAPHGIMQALVQPKGLLAGRWEAAG